MPVLVEVDGKEISYTEKQFLFSEHFLRCGNATRSAKDAGYSPKTAGIIGFENLRKPKIQALLKQRMKDAVMDTDEVLFRLGNMARSSVDDISVIDDKGRMKLDFKKAKNNGAIHLIRSITPNAHGTKVEMHDQRAALNDIGKYLGMEHKEPEQDDFSDNVLPSIPAEMIAPDFLKVHRDIVYGNNKEYILKGGRGSTKSSFAALEIIYLIVNNPTWHALAMRDKEKDLEKSVFNQIDWAIRALGLSGEFKKTSRPREFTYKKTGQKIFFSGANSPDSSKGFKLPFGYIAIGWFEELDQFRGGAAIRLIEQSFMRGGDKFYQFKTYNPPKSANNWVNRDVLLPKKGRYVHDSNYLNVPIEWLGHPFIDDAEHLKSISEDIYNHEYLGMVTGTGGQVFDNLEVREITDEEIATFGETLHGNDWGYFPDPFSYGKMYYDPARLALYIFGEFRSFKQSNAASYESITENGYNSNELLIADSAEPKSISDYAEYGAWVRGAEKGPGSVTYSMKWLQSRAKIVLDPARVPFHTQEFTEYELEQDKNGDFISAYPDKNNHAIDDARYATNLIWRRRGE